MFNPRANIDSTMARRRSWWLSKTLTELDGQLKKLFPADKLPDWTIGDARHARRKSDHNADKTSSPPGVVRAVDIRLSGGGPALKRIAEAIRKGQDPRVKYCIYNRRMFSSYRHGAIPPWTWRPYSNARRMPHLSHVHLSVLPDGDHDGTPLKLDTPDAAGGRAGMKYEVVDRFVLMRLLTSWTGWKRDKHMCKLVQLLVKTPADGIWGPNSKRAFEKYFDDRSK